MGVLILRSGVVGSNTHRPLSVEEFRGFTISDEISPLVFINSRDTKAAQIFTLAHELAHLWVGASGVSNIALRSNAQDLQGLELACNSIAAEFLVPADTLAERAYGKEVTLELAQSLARSFRVSVLVVLRRFYELGQLHRGEFFEFYDQAIAAMPERKKAKGGDAERNLIARNSPRLTQEVISELRGQRLSHSDAAALLGASVAVIAKLSASEGPPSAEVPV